MNIRDILESTSDVTECSPRIRDVLRRDLPEFPGVQRFWLARDEEQFCIALSYLFRWSITHNVSVIV